MAKPQLEKDIQSAICDYLQLKRYFFWRQNTAPTVQKNDSGWFFRKMPKHSRRGVPDIIVIRKGTVIFLEVKRPGGKLSPDQEDFKDDCIRESVQYHVVTSIDDVAKIGL